MFQTTLFSNIITERTPDTREIARKRSGTKKRDIQRALMRTLLEKDGLLAADDWAIERGLSILAVRPRVSELNKAGLLWKGGIAKTVDGNPQQRFGLKTHYAREIMSLGGFVGLDAAIDETLTRAGL